MRTRLPFILLFLAFGVLLGAAFAPSRIRWQFQTHDDLIWDDRNSGHILQLGLRDDGVVVWREITTATNVIVTTTNSPAERQEIPYGTLILTNMSITNLIYDDLIPRWYLSPTGIVYRP